MCSLSVDGTIIRNSVCLDLNSSSETRQLTFKGFRVNSDIVQAFVFSDIVACKDPIDGTSRAGLLQVSVYEAERFQSETHIYPVTSPAPTLRSVSEDKKFWQQPSLSTIRGKDLAIPYLAADIRPMRQVPDATLSIQYHTAAVFDFLQNQRKKFYARSVPASSVPVLIDLTEEPNPMSPELVPMPKSPVVVDLCGQDEIDTEIEEDKQVAVKKLRRFRRIGDKTRTEENRSLQERKKKGAVKVEKKSRGKGVDKKKKVVRVAARGKSASKKARI